MKTATHNPTFKPTVKGSLSLSQLRKVSQEMAECQAVKTIAGAVDRLKFSKTEEKKKAKAQTVKLSYQKAQRQQYFSAVRGMHSCLACGSSISHREARVVLFQLFNGNEGEMAGKLCTHHKPGDSWRDVGTIVSLDKPSTLKKEPGAAHWSLPLAKGQPVKQETSKPQDKQDKPALTQRLYCTLCLFSTSPQTVRTAGQASKLSLSTLRKHVSKLVKLGYLKAHDTIKVASTKATRYVVC